MRYTLRAFSYPAKTKRGFTLLEILIVIAIILILVAVVYGSLGAGRAKARDAARISDIRQIEVALEAYAKAFDSYPSLADGACAWDTSFGSSGCMQVLVEKGFFNELPTPPTNSEHGYYYDNWCRTPSGNDPSRYRLWTVGEGNHDGLSKNWWEDSTIGVTSCTDPS